MQKKSFVLKTADLTKRFLIIDCGEKPVVLGRLATEVVKLLKGKDLVCYTPHTCGANTKVIIVNADKIVVTGDKANQKLYRRYTGYVGGLKEVVYKNMKKTDVIEKAIRGMINKGPMRNELMKRLYVYPSAEHPHMGQQPVSHTF